MLIETNRSILLGFFFNFCGKRLCKKVNEIGGCHGSPYLTKRDLVDSRSTFYDPRMGWEVKKVLMTVNMLFFRDSHAVHSLLGRLLLRTTSTRWHPFSSVTFVAWVVAGAACSQRSRVAIWQG